MAGASSDSNAAPRPPESLVVPLRALMRGADIVVVNSENAIGDGVVDGPKCTPARRYCYALRAPPSAAMAIRTIGDRSAGVIANVAKTHAHDAGDAGDARCDLLEHCEQFRSQARLHNGEAGQVAAWMG